MSSPDHGPARALVGRLFNQPAPPSWRVRACHTFGSPWLELVLRAVSAFERNAGGDHTIDEGFREAWELALQGYTLHREVRRGPQPQLRACFAALEELVDELERAVTRPSIDPGARLSVLLTEVSSRTDQLRAHALARAEVERSDLSSILSGRTAQNGANT